MIPSEFGAAAPALRNIYQDIDKAYEAARHYLFNEITSSSYEKHGERIGDRSSIHDAVVFDRFFRQVAHSHNMLLVCEEQTRKSLFLNRKDCDYLIVIDPIDGSVNMMSGMTFGVNVAFGALPRSGDFTMGHIQGVFVADYLTQKRFVWLEGCPTVIENPVYAPSLKWGLFSGGSNVFEIPDESSYLLPSYLNGEMYQRNLIKIFRQLFPGAQRRAIDCTGLRILETCNGNILAYGDVRRASKIWDTIPSVKFVLEHTKTLVALTGDLTEYSAKTQLLRRQEYDVLEVADCVGDEVIIIPRAALAALKKYNTPPKLGRPIRCM